MVAERVTAALEKTSDRLLKRGRRHWNLSAETPPDAAFRCADGAPVRVVTLVSVMGPRPSGRSSIPWTSWCTKWVGSMSSSTREGVHQRIRLKPQCSTAGLRSRGGRGTCACRMRAAGLGSCRSPNERLLESNAASPGKERNSQDQKPADGLRAELRGRSKVEILDKEDSCGPLAIGFCLRSVQ